MAHRAYAADETTEAFRCTFGLNPAYRSYFRDGLLNVTGVDPDGDARIVELSGHPFFMATLFLPQLRSRPGEPHPLVRAYLDAALTLRTGVTQ